MSSRHARPASQPDPADRRASGAGVSGDGGRADGGHGGDGYGYGRSYTEVYGAPYQDADQAYAGEGYGSPYADSGCADTGYPNVGYSNAGYSDAGCPDAAYGVPGHAEPVHEESVYAAPAYPGGGYAEARYAAPAGEEFAPAGRAAGTATATPTRTGSRAASRTGTRTQVRAAAKARARRKRRVRNGFLGVGSVAAATVIAVAGFLHPAAPDHTTVAAAGPTVDSGRGSSAPADASRSVARPTPTTALAKLPGLGKSFLAKIPANAQQVFVVSGTGKNASTATAVLYTRTADGSWLPGTAWPAHNAKDGWTGDHMAGDLHSPIGVFSLTDAGGLDPNPGTKLPYLHSSAFKALGTGFEGESLADAFDYVVAINYNHDPGTSPLSPDRPLGESRGGGIWIHVDHGGPTHGCVSLSKANMAVLLKDLDPAKHPVVVMGDAASLSA